MERTRNMPAVALTLDVSKVSGWLNEYACCRVERRAHDVRRGVRDGRRECVYYVGQYRRKRYAWGRGLTEALGAQGAAERT